MSTRALYSALASGETDLAVPSDYIAQEHVKLYSRPHEVLGEGAFDGTLLSLGTHYTWLNAGTLRLTTPADGETDFLVARETPVLPLVTQQPGVFSSAKSNLAVLQSLYVAEEARDLQEGLTDLTLRTELASLDDDRGAGLLGFSHAADYDYGTLGAKAKQSLHATDEPYRVVPDGSTDNTAALQQMVDDIIASPTNPLDFSGTILSGRGLRCIFLPKGRIKTTAYLIAAAALSGFSIVGEAKDATTIEVHGADQGFLKGAAYLNLTLSDLSIVNVDAGDRATWTNNGLEFSGVGGGRNLQLIRVQFRGFNHQIHYSGTNNCDTTFAQGCDFFSANVVLYGRNSQGLINTFLGCSYYGPGTAFDIAGMGHTQIIGGNMTLDGSWLNLHGQSGLWGPTSVFTLINVKGEPTNWSGYAGGSRSKLIGLSGDKSFISCSINMIGCGFTSGVALDPAYRQIELTSNIRLTWKEGQLKNTATMVTYPYQTFNVNSSMQGGMYVEGLLECPVPAPLSGGTGFVERIAATSDNTTHPQLSFERNTGINNITILPPAGTYSDFPPRVFSATKRNDMASGLHYYGVLSFGSNLVHTLDFYGSSQTIDEVEVRVKKKAAAANLKVEISFDPTFATGVDIRYITGEAGSTNLPVLRLSDPMLGSKTHDWASLATAAQQSTTVTALGARVGDRVEVSMSVALGGCRLWGEVTADDTVTVYQRNDTGSTVDVVSGTLKVAVHGVSAVLGQVCSDKIYARFSGPRANGRPTVTHTAA